MGRRCRRGVSAPQRTCDPPPSQVSTGAGLRGGGPCSGFPKLLRPHQPTGAPSRQQWRPVAGRSPKVARTASIGGNTGHLHCFPHLTTAHFRSSKADAPVASWPRPILPGEPLLQLRPSHHGRRLHTSHTQDDQRFQKVLQDGLARTSTSLVTSGPPGEADRPQGWGVGSRSALPSRSLSPG